MKGKLFEKVKNELRSYFEKMNYKFTYIYLFFTHNILYVPSLKTSTPCVS